MSPAAADRARWSGRPTRDLARVTAPDVVLAVSRDGRRTVVCGGTADRPPGTRENLRYELGSLSKTFTGLLLAELARVGTVALDDPLTARLPGPPPPGPYARLITLRHLVTHTSGLPRVPRDLVAGALLRPYTDGYAGYGTERVLRAFARTPLRHVPGSRWHYSNFGLALLGCALAHTTGTDFPELLADRVLRPLRLAATVRPATGHDSRDATGYRPDGRTPMPPTDMAGFSSAGGVRATPADLLTYAEAHLRPETTVLEAALRQVRLPQLRRGRGHRHTHTLTWFRHPAPGGPLFFHAGASFGQQSFAGYHPASGTAVVALATRHDRLTKIVGTGYTLLYDLCAEAARTAAPADTAGALPTATRADGRTAAR